MELVDTLGSGSSPGNGVGVRVSPSAPYEDKGLQQVVVIPFSFTHGLQCVFPALHQRRGQAPSTGSFSDRFLNNSPSISAAQYAHPQAVIFEVAEAIRSPLNQLHFSMETFCNAVIPSKTEHSGHFFPPIMQRLAQGAQRREGCFSKLINFIQ